MDGRSFVANCGGTMFFSPTRAVFAVITLLLTACVNSPYRENMDPVPLLKAALPHITSTKVVIGLDPANSTNFIPQHQGSSGQQYGLVGVLVEAMVVRSMNDTIQVQQRLMTPIRSAAINFNFGSHFRERLENSISDIDWLHVDYVTKAPRFQRFSAEALQKESSEAAILVADTFFKMEEDFSKMTISAYMILIPNTPELKSIAGQQQEVKGEENPVLARHQFSVSYPLEGDFSNKQQAAQEWAKDNAAMVHRALENGINDLTQKIAEHLKTTWIIVG